MSWSGCGGGIGRAKVGVKGKKPSKREGKKRENMAMSHLEASIPAGDMLVSLRKQHV
jgi:hypothetical protein